MASHWKADQKCTRSFRTPHILHQYWRRILVFSAQIRQLGLQREPCSCPWGTPYQPAYVSVVYFNSCGSVDVCTRSHALSNVKICSHSPSMSSKGSCYSWPPRPATFALYRRCLGRCQRCLPVKIGQIIGSLGLQCPSCDRVENITRKQMHQTEIQV